MRCAGRAPRGGRGRCGRASPGFPLRTALTLTRTCLTGLPVADGVDADVPHRASCSGPHRRGRASPGLSGRTAPTRACLTVHAEPAADAEAEPDGVEYPASEESGDEHEVEEEEHAGLGGVGFDAERDELYARMRYVVRGQVEPPKARDETRGEKRRPVLSLLEHAYTCGASVVGSLGMMMRLRGGGGTHRRRRTASSSGRCKKAR